MIKKYLLLFCSIFIFSLTGCFGGDDVQDEIPANYTTYNAPAFSVYIPENWETIEQYEFSEEIPSQTQVVFRNNIKNDKFTSNAHITKQLLNEPMNSHNYGQLVIEKNKDLINYKEISRDNEFNLIIGENIDKTILITFEGKADETQPSLRFIQTYAVDGADAYSITASYLASADEFEAEDAKNIVKSFKIN